MLNENIVKLKHKQSHADRGTSTFTEKMIEK